MFASQAEGIAGPLPVAVVTADEDQALAFGGQLVEYGQGLGRHAAVPEHGSFGDAEGLEHFEKEVAQVVIEIAGEAVDLVGRLIGKGVAEIFEYDIFSVADDPEQDETNEVGKGVQDRERQEGQRIERAVKTVKRQ